MEKTSPMAKRPLSPHLQIYKPQLTSVLSITHRLTGIYLCASVLGILSWIYALASSPECFYATTGFWNGTLGKLIIFSWCVCFYYHLSNGIRHLFWDVGRGFDLPSVYRSGWLVVSATVFLSLLTALIIF